MDIVNLLLDEADRFIHENRVTPKIVEISQETRSIILKELNYVSLREIRNSDYVLQVHVNNGLRRNEFHFKTITRHARSWQKED